MTNQIVKENLLELLAEYTKGYRSKNNEDNARKSVVLALKAIDAYDMFEGELDRPAHEVYHGK